MLTTLSITWLLVSTSPDEVMTIPVPATLPLWAAVVALISTVAASTFARFQPALRLQFPLRFPVRRRHLRSRRLRRSN